MLKGYKNHDHHNNFNPTQVGYYHGKTYFAGLRKAGQLWFMSRPAEDRRRSLESLDPVASVARFTDLAEMVCRVRQPVTPERDVRDRLLLEDELDTEPDEEEIVSEEEEEDEDMEEGESGFISHAADTGLNISLPGYSSGLGGYRRAGSGAGSRSSASRRPSSVVRRGARHSDSSSQEGA